jgi:hypothetical protein
MVSTVLRLMVLESDMIGASMWMMIVKFGCILYEWFKSDICKECIILN